MASFPSEKRAWELVRVAMGAAAYDQEFVHYDIPGFPKKRDLTDAERAVVAQHPGPAASYAYYVCGHFVEAEGVISTCSISSLQYARAIRGPFPAGEWAIAQNAVDACDYAVFLGSRFFEGEPAIMSNADTSLMYAINVTSERLPREVESFAAREGEPSSCAMYALDVIRGPFPEAEPNIAKEGFASYAYATNVLKARFLAGEVNLHNWPPDIRDSYIEIFGKEMRVATKLYGHS